MSPETQVRRAAREALAVLQNTKAVVKARLDLLAFDRQRLDFLDDAERVQVIQLCVQLCVALELHEQLDFALTLLPRVEAQRP